MGNSASVRIPAAVMKAANLSLDEIVDVREEGGRIVIEPVRPSEYDLAHLLVGITPENLRAEVIGPGAILSGCTPTRRLVTNRLVIGWRWCSAYRRTTVRPA